MHDIESGKPYMYMHGRSGHECVQDQVLVCGPTITLVLM